MSWTRPYKSIPVLYREDTTMEGSTLNATRGADASLGTLLRRWRRRLDLTQEELAGRSGLSVQSIRNLERDVPHVPRQATLQLLMAALDLSEDEQSLCRQAAHRRSRRADTASTQSVDPGRLILRPLPVLPLAPLIGRDSDLAQAKVLALRPATRLLTICGPAGVGKTRLAQTLAHELHPMMSMPVGFADLAVIRQVETMATIIAESVGVRESERQSLWESIGQRIDQHAVLLFLDNVEQLLPDAALPLANLLAICPNLRLIVTSRVALHLRDEQCLPLEPLTIPDLDALPSLAELERVPAVMLLLDRFRAIQPTFRLEADNSRAIATICCRLDGLPLALELIARWLRLLAPRALARQMDHRLSFLDNGAHDLSTWQRSIRAALDGSYTLVPESAQRLLCWLGVCQGGYTLPLATALFHSAHSAHSSAVQFTDQMALQNLHMLADYHLIQYTGEAGHEPRYRLLETVAEYATERLGEAGETRIARQAHAEYFAAWAEEAMLGVRHGDQQDWLARLDAEQHNVRGALQWAIGDHAAAIALRLAGSLWNYWYTRGWYREGQQWLSQALQFPKPTDTPLAKWLAWRRTACTGAGVLAERLGHLSQAEFWHRESLECARQLGDTVGMAAALNNLGMIAFARNAFVEAQTLYSDGQKLLHHVPPSHVHSALLVNLGRVATTLGQTAEALAWYLQALDVDRYLDDRLSIAVCLNNLGVLALEEGEYTEARKWLTQSLELREQLGDSRGIPVVLCNLGLVLCRLQDHDEAQRILEDCLNRFTQQGEVWHLAEAERYLAEVYGVLGRKLDALQLLQSSLAKERMQGNHVGIAACYEACASLVKTIHPMEAVALLSRAYELRRLYGAAIPLAERKLQMEWKAELQAILGQDSFQSAWELGTSLEDDSSLFERVQIA